MVSVEEVQVELEQVSVCSAKAGGSLLLLAWVLLLPLVLAWAVMQALAAAVAVVVLIQTRYCSHWPEC